MREVVSISLSTEFKKRLDHAAKQDGVSRSHLIQDVLKRSLDLREVEQMRRELRPYAERLGVFSDEEVVALIERRRKKK
jgi:metal-responsive CopG/Arc/MetJ family transcriptional regulator